MNKNQKSILDFSQKNIKITNFFQASWRSYWSNAKMRGLQMNGVEG